MTNKWIYDKVNHLVKKYKTRNPEELAKCLGINIKYLPETVALLGMYKILMRVRFIFLPINVGALKNTVLAHEIGHDQLHREYCKNGAVFHDNRVFNPTNQYEIEANIFAAHLLIPDDDVFRLIKHSENDRDLAYELDVDINLLNLKISELAKMNMLDFDKANLKIPNSEFLKYYKPDNRENYN